MKEFTCFILQVKHSNSGEGIKSVGPENVEEHVLGPANSRKEGTPVGDKKLNPSKLE